MPSTSTKARAPWKPKKLSPRGPVYLAIADALGAAVTAGELAAGERLPTHRSLASELGVNVVTITRAYAEAARRGLVDGHVGRGTFVRALEPLPRARRARASGPGVIDLSQNQLALDGGTFEGLFATQAKRLEAALRAGYASGGQAGQRAAGAAWLARAGVEVSPDEVVITTGGQEALAVALIANVKAGDTVLVEELTYGGVKTLAALLRIKLVPVAMDAEGLLPDALEQACLRTNPALLYVMPNLHNPTGCVLSLERRRRVAELARRFGLRVLEDDVAGFLLESPPAPIAALAPERTLYVTSLSKSLSPSLRVGYLAARGELLEGVQAAHAALTWMTPALMAEIASHAITSGLVARVVEKKRAELRRRRALFAPLARQLTTRSHADSPCLWVELPEPWRVEEFVSAAERAGVLVTGAEVFSVARTHTPQAVRLCPGAPATRAEFETAVARLGELLAGSPAPQRVPV
ncbi:MAG: PLP-dependent aminotransferase family protein [Planctomycetota bacterium]